MKNVFAYVFLGFGVLIFSTRFLFANFTIDIQLHDTYYVIAYEHVSNISSLVLAIAGLFYFFISQWKQLNNWLSLIHFLLTSISMCCFLNAVSYANANCYPKYYSLGDFGQNAPLDANAVISISLLVFMTAQLLLVINIFISPKIIVKR